MSKVVHYPECAFCNADNTGHDKVFCQPKYIVSKAGKPCALWYCPNNCKDGVTGAYNKIENPFLKNEEIDILVEQGALPTEALAAKKVFNAPLSGSSSLGKRASPWTGPVSNVDVSQPNLQPAVSNSDPVTRALEAINQIDNVRVLLSISGRINERVLILIDKKN